MRKRTLLLIGMLAVLFSINSPVQQQDLPQHSFRLVSTQPEDGSSISDHAEISLEFNKPVNCETVEASITIVPDLPGQFSCNNRNVLFVPTENWGDTNAYTVRIHDTLQAHTGEYFSDTKDIRLYSSGFLLVSELLPADGAQAVAPDALFTVVFNRPVIPLVTSANPGNPPQPLSFAPAIEGEGEWLNTFIYQFTPSQLLEPATEYTLTVDGNLEALDGARMPRPLTATFTTDYPQMVRVRLDGQTQYQLTPTINLYFNMKVNQDQIEDGFSLSPVTDYYITRSMGSDDYPALNTLQRGEPVVGNFEWSDDGSIAFFTPDEDLNIETTYVLEINTDAIINSPEETLWSFSTLPYPQLVDITPQPGSRTDNYHGFTLEFNTYIDAATVNERLTIEPEPEAFSGYRSDMNFVASFSAKGSTTYHIRIEPGIMDIYGNIYDKPIEFSYTTLPYRPSIHLRVPGQVGFYNAYNDETTLYVQHLNVDRLTIELNTLDPEQFTALVFAERGEPNLYDYNIPPESLLREWQVEVPSPQDTGIPTLLYLGEATGCERDDEIELRIGDVVAIRSNDPVEGFANPGANEPTLTLFKDLELPIVGGPICVEEHVWWRLEIANSQLWVAEDRANLEYIDSTATTAIDVADEGSNALKPGIYTLRVNIEDPPPEDTYYLRHTMAVMTANLTVKSSLDELTIWATDVQSGEPIARQPITVYDQSGIIAAGVTNEIGLLTLPVPPVENIISQQRVVIMDTGEHFGVGMSGWADGIDPGMFEIPANFTQSHYNALIYTDRQAYRPGETVYYRGVVRVKDDMTYTPPDAFDTVTVSTCNGGNCIETDVPLTIFGAFSGSFIIADNASLSGYNLVSVRSEVGDQTLFNANAAYSIAEFRLPEFRVAMTPAEANYAQGDTVQIGLNGEYYSGGPVTNADVSYNIVATPMIFRYAGEGHYNFAYYDPERDYWTSREVAEGKIVTDSGGEAVLEIPADLGGRSESQRYTVEATLQDETDQTVSNRTSVDIHAGEYYIGTRPEHYLVRQGEEAEINMIMVDWDSIGIAGQEVNVEVFQRQWNNIQRQDPATGYTYWEYEVEEIPITNDVIVSDEDGNAVYSFIPDRGGTHYIVFTTRDKHGNEIVNSQYLWVTSHNYVSWQMNNNNRIPLIADQDDYNVGDTAEILIASPFQAASYALITVERQGVLKSEVVTMDTNSYIYRLPIEEDFAPNVFVSVMVVSGVNEFNRISEFRMGLLQIPVSIDRKRLNVEIEPSADRVQPQDTVMYTVRTTNYAGEPVRAEVGVALTDATALVIAPPPSLNEDWMLNYFYREQGLSVRTSTPLTINTDRVTQTTLDAVKGGGGGGGYGLPVTFDVREDFISTPYWNAEALTDENGEATFAVTLPDNLTTWTLNAHALTSGEDGLTLFGQAMTDIISTHPVLIRPVTPRFMVVDDELVFAAVINNNSGEAITADVWIDVEDVTLRGDARQTVEIPPEARVRVEWPVTVENVPYVEAVFYVASQDGIYTDASRPPLGQGEDRLLPVYRYEAPETIGTSGMLRENSNRTEVIDLPDDFEIVDGNVTIRLQSSLAATTLDSLQYLETYPYYCIEQTVSRFLPNIITYRALDELGLADPELQTNLNNMIRIALQKLYNEQKADGGWGWFYSEQSDPVTTAYALIGLIEAERYGFYINPVVTQNAQSFLATRLIAIRLDTSVWELNRQAFLLYALARAGAPNVAATTNLFDVRDQLNMDARAYLALTLHMIDPETTIRTDAILSDFNTSAIVSATGSRWEEASLDRWNWSSDIRTTSLALEMLVTLDPESNLIPNVVRWLITNRTNFHWRTTQETAWAVMALTDWMRISGDLSPNYGYSVTYNDEIRLQEIATSETIRETQELIISVQEMLQSEVNTIQFSRTDGNGGLYYTAHLNVNLPVPEISALDRGISIARRYTLAGDDGGTPITEARVGENVQVHLTIVAPQALHYINIEDPIPAGVEAINPNLQTSQQIGTRPNFNRIDPNRGWGWWWFSNIEFRDEKVVLSASYLPAGVYEFVYTVRPVLPGVYNVIPTTGQEFYFPEIYGRGDGMTFAVLPAEG